MTIMGLDFLKHEETKRSNLAKEKEQRRSNLANESEAKRSNLAREAETYRANVAKESENVRYHNLDTKLKSEWQNYQYWYNDQMLALQTKASEAQTALNVAYKEKAISDKEFQELNKSIQAARADAEIALNAAKTENLDIATAQQKIDIFTTIIDSFFKIIGNIPKYGASMDALFT